VYDRATPIDKKRSSVTPIGATAALCLRVEGAAQLEVDVPAWPDRLQPFDQPATGQLSQVTTERFRRGDDQVAQLAKTCSAGIDSTIAGDHQRSECCAVAAGTRLGWMLLSEHDPCGSDRVQRIGLAA
jgi:hypothetical protein